MSVPGASVKVAILKTEQSIPGEEQEARLHATEFSLQTEQPLQKDSAQLFKTPWKFQYLVYKSQLGSSSTSRKGDHPIHNVHTRWHRMKCLPKLCEVWCKLGWSSYSKFSNARWTLLLPLLSLPVSLFFNCEVLPDYKDNSIFLLQRIDLKINICKDGNKKWVTIWRRETNSSVLIKNSPYVII